MPRFFMAFALLAVSHSLDQVVVAQTDPPGVALPQGVPGAPIWIIPTTDCNGYRVGQSRRMEPGQTGIWLKLIIEPEKIVRIEFGNYPISDEDLAVLPRFCRLKEIGFFSAPIREESLAILGKIPNLELVHVEQMPLKGTFLKATGESKQLRRLKLRNTQFEETSMAYLAQFPNLEELDLGFKELSDEGAKVLAELKQLKILMLSGTRISNATAQRLAESKELRQLYLDGTQIDSRGADFLAGLPELQELHASQTRIDNSGVRALAKLSKIEVLRLNNTPIDDGALKALAGHASLRVLCVGNGTIKPDPAWPKTKITNGGIEPLLSIPTLEEVTVRGTEVTRIGWTRLFELPKFRRIWADDSMPKKNRVEFQVERKETTVGSDEQRILPWRLEVTKLTGGDDIGRLFDNTTRKRIGATMVFPGSAGKVTSYDFSPDKQCVAIGSYNMTGGRKKGSLTVWEIATGDLIFVPRGYGMGPIHSVRFDPDGKTIHLVTGKLEKADSL